MVESASIAARVGAGEVVLVPELLQRIGWYERLIGVCRSELDQLLGAEGTASVIGAAFSNLHQQLSVAQLFEFNRRSMRQLASLAPALLRDFAQQLLQRRGVYAECYPNMRTIVPHDCAALHALKFQREQRRRGAGKVTIHAPHYDSWHRNPLNAINLWCALSPVSDGNGMLVYPAGWGRQLLSDGAGAVRRDQWVGTPLNFRLQPGDALVFMGNQLHSSEVNRTAASRCVISLRLTLQRPDFDGRPYAFPYVYADWIGTRLERFAHQRVRWSLDYLAARARRLLRRRPPSAPARFAPLVDSSHEYPAPISASWSADHSYCSIRADAVRCGEIRPISADLCIARTAAGYRLFSRRCPHQGADLAGASIRADGDIACPWHNLAFNADRGVSACRSIAPLAVTTGVTRGRYVYFGPMARAGASMDAPTKAPLDAAMNQSGAPLAL